MRGWQVAALRLVEEGLTEGPQPGPITAGTPDLLRVFPRLLTAASSRHSSTRRLALASLQHLHGLPSLESPTQAALQELGAALEPCASLVEADAGALPLLLAAALGRAPAAPPSASKGGKGKAAKRKSTAALQADAPYVPHLPCLLPLPQLPCLPLASHHVAQQQQQSLSSVIISAASPQCCIKSQLGPVCCTCALLSVA